MNVLSIELQGLDAAVAGRLRAGGGAEYVADEHPGYPCRQCLADAQVGDRLLLVSHDPFHADSPYRSASPIFIHAEPCHTFDGEIDGSRSWPTQLTSRQLSVRGFDDAAMMIDAAVIDGDQLDVTVNRLFGDPSITSIHIHNATRGCWAATVTRTNGMS